MITVKNNVDSTDIYIVGDIVDDAWKGWSWGEDMDTYPSDIRNLLSGANGKDINVYINSGGGDLFAGVAICNMLKRHNANTKAVVDGLAGSAASIIAFGCNEIEIPQNAYLMIHKPSCGCYGNSDDLLKMASVLEELQEGIVNTYMSKTHENVDEETINNLINAETWMTGKKAKEYFDVTVIGENTVFDNDVGNCIFNYTKTPEIFKNIKNKTYEDKRKAIEVALNL